MKLRNWLFHSPLSAFLASSIALWTGTTCLGQTDATDAQVEREITEYMDAINKLGPFNGVILVAKKSRIIVSRGYGMAAFEFCIPNSPRTRFRIASVSKPITATAVMLLVDERKLAVTDPI